MNRTARMSPYSKKGFRARTGLAGHFGARLGVEVK
jgi:hypothetical protein